MAKKFIKELIISLLLCLAVILLLGILLYEYVPNTKTIPNPVSYTAPDSVKQELADMETLDESQIIMTYEVNTEDLNNYKRIQDYKPGKVNPFSSYEAAETNGTDTTQDKSSTGADGTNDTGTSENQTQDNTTTSGGKLFQDKGTK